MNKQDYISMINYGCTSYTCKKGLFELVEKYFKLKDDCEKLNKKNKVLYHTIYDAKPYKFEDLKRDMWAWDEKEEEICYIEFIDKISSDNGLIKILWIEYLKSHVSGEYICQIEFEENRFFPVYKSMWE